jgi:hypothetical protein
MINKLMVAIASTYDVDLIQTAIFKGFHWSVFVSAEIARLGDLRLLRFVQKQGCPINRWACIGAVEADQFECFAYTLTFIKQCSVELIKTCCKNVRYIVYALQYNAHFVEREYASLISRYAAEKGYICVLELLKKMNAEWCSNIAVYAVIGNDVNMLRYVTENGCEKWNSVCSVATFYGHLECLKYAIKNNYPSNSRSIVLNCLVNNHFECLTYVLKAGCGVYDMINLAAILNRLDFLKECRKYSNWKQSAEYAAKYGNLECLKFCIMHNGRVFSSHSYEDLLINRYPIVPIGLDTMIDLTTINERRRSCVDFLKSIRLLDSSYPYPPPY